MGKIVCIALIAVLSLINLQSIIDRYTELQYSHRNSTTVEGEVENFQYNLNGADSFSGIETVGEAMADETTSAFLSKAMNEEILPVVGKNEDSLSFAESVSDRFRNPFIRHKWRAISLNSVSKFSVRVLPTVLEYKEKYGEYPKYLSLSTRNIHTSRLSTNSYYR